MKKIFPLLLLALCFSACEKDDICDETTPTTPRLVVQFYDFSNPTIPKNVTALRAIAPGFTDGFDFSGVSRITIPLRTTSDTTTINLIQNGADNDATNNNTDVLTLNYSRDEVFVSRACGYRTVFTLNSPGGVSLTDNLPADTIWIQNSAIATNNIETENEIHLKLYF